MANVYYVYTFCARTEATNRKLVVRIVYPWYMPGLATRRKKTLQTQLCRSILYYTIVLRSTRQSYGNLFKDKCVPTIFSRPFLHTHTHTRVSCTNSVRGGQMGNDHAKNLGANAVSCCSSYATTAAVMSSSNHHSSTPRRLPRHSLCTNMREWAMVLACLKRFYAARVEIIVFYPDPQMGRRLNRANVFCCL